MKTRTKYVTLALAALLVLSLLVCAGTATVTGGPPSTSSIVISGTLAGQTELSIGAVEACLRFNVDDMTALGINNYRIYAGMSRVEPNDDDGVYGSPSIAEIKADPNVIPWSEWDYWFGYEDGYFWEMSCNTEPLRAQVPLATMLTQLKGAGVMPIITLRPVDNHDQPVWAMQLNPPNSTEDWNEWWEFVFAWVYYANVLHDYDVHDWQVHNEPDNDSQGWDGTMADYSLLTQWTADAIQYVYDTYLPGETFRLYAPVATHCDEWITEALIANDDVIDVVDWHRYSPPEEEAATVQGWIDQYDSDGVHELAAISEWGTYKESYDLFSNGLKFGQAIITHSRQESKVDISSIFSLYEWSVDGFSGVLDREGTPSETFYSMRLLIRGLQGGRDAYQMTETYTDRARTVANGKAADGTLYVAIVNRTTQNQNVDLDVSAHVDSATATVYEFSETVKDEVVGTLALSDGAVNFTIPRSSIWLIAIPTGGTPPTDTPEPGPTDTPAPPTDTPEPQPTDTPEPGGAMHVSDVSFSTRTLGAFKKVKALVTIVDVGDAPVGSATVYGDYSGVMGASVNAITAGDGVATMPEQSDRNGGTWTFCVTDVVKSGWTYDDSANVETCDSITFP